MTVTIDGLTKTRMLEIEAASVVGGVVNVGGHLILSRHDGATIDAGSVIGPQGPPYVNGVDTVSDQNVGGNKTFTRPLVTKAPNADIFALKVLNHLNNQIFGIYSDTGGKGVLELKDGANPTFSVDGFGAAKSKGSSSLFGGGALGADMSAVQVGQYDPDYSLVNAYNNVRANVNLLLQSKGAAGVVIRLGGDTATNLNLAVDKTLYVGRSTLGMSMVITQGSTDLATGSVRISRTSSAHAQSLVFNAGLGYDYIIGRLGGSDDLVFGVNFGAGFTERVRMDTAGNVKTPIGGSFQCSDFRTIIPAGEFGQARMISPSNYGRVELQGNSNGLILSNNAGTSKWLIGARFDVAGNADDLVIYGYAGKVNFWIGGNNSVEIGADGNGVHLFVNTNPGTGTDSGMALNFSFIGLKRLSCGAADSAGAGFRMVRCAN